MKIVNIAQMQDIERRCAEEGVSTAELMENAGLAVARLTNHWMEEASGKRIVILIGPGNNGGDGLVAARHLQESGAMVFAYMAAPRPEDDKNYKLVVEKGIICNYASKDVNGTLLAGLLDSSNAVLDCVFGTGKSRAISGVYKRILEKVTEAKANHPELHVIAVDVPSGLDSDTGAVDPATPKADLTIALGYPKLGMLLFPGAEVLGTLAVANIGIPPHLAEDIKLELLSESWVRSVLPARPLNANKGTFGKALVVAGSINYIGAAYLACSGAMRVGAGLVTLATPKSLQAILASKLTEVTYLPMAEEEPGIISPEAAAMVQESISQYDVLLLGCGMGQSQPVAEFVMKVSLLPRKNGIPLVLDADGLNVLSNVKQWWKKIKGDIVVTPHPGEMARLCGITVDEVQSDRLGVAMEMSKRWGVVVVLKGAHTVIASPDGRVQLSSVANPGLASAGTGDVLAGIIAGLVAQGLKPFEAAACGVYLHGAAADAISGDLGDAGMVASDLLPVLPRIIKNTKGG